MAAFELDDDKLLAARLIAEGDLTNDEIAERVDIGVATLYRWKNYQEFKDEIKTQKDKIREDLYGFQFANIAHRINRANQRLRQIGRLTDARAKEYADQPGGETGLIVKDYKGSGDNLRTVFAFDAAVIKEERELLKYMSQELGQWTEKTELSGKLELTDEEKRAKAEAILERIAEDKRKAENA
jgi:hypothetical protein